MDPEAAVALTGKQLPKEGGEGAAALQEEKPTAHAEGNADLESKHGVRLEGQSVSDARNALPTAQTPKLPPQLELVMDDRELKSPLAKHLFAKGIKLHPKRLDVADFIVSDQIAIERKTAADFETSIIDGRLFAQCKDLNANFAYPLLCVVGDDFSRLSPRAVAGAQIAVATEFRIPIFHFDTEEDLADFMHLLLLQKSKPRKEPKLRFEKKPLSKDGQLQMVLEGIPMIGPVQAQNLLKKFRTLQKVFSASEKALQKAEGIGGLRAKQVRLTASAIYGEDEKAQMKLGEKKAHPEADPPTEAEVAKKE